MADYYNTNLVIKQSHRAFDNAYFGAGQTGPTGPQGVAGTNAMAPYTWAGQESNPYTTLVLTNFTRSVNPFSNITFNVPYGGATNMIIDFKIYISSTLSTFSTTNRNNFYVKGCLVRRRDNVVMCETEPQDLRIVDDGNRADTIINLSAMTPTWRITTPDTYDFCIMFLTDNGTARTATLVYKPLAYIHFI